MASNPKYAELPGFATDQPDIYETESLPEADQIYQSIDESEAVEVLHISTKDAYDTFKYSRVDSSKTNFMDDLTSRGKTGYNVTYGNWEVNDEQDDESLSHRYHRIKAEVKQFLEDITAIEQEKKPDNHEVLLADMEMLEKLLAELNLEAIVSEGAGGVRSDEMSKRLLAQLSSLNAQTDSPKEEKKASNDPKGSLTYELFYKPEYSKLQQAQKVAFLEERIRQLEATVGEDKQKLSMLSAQTAGKSLQDICDDLSSKYYLLDFTNIERVESQLVALHEKLLAVSERKQALEEAQKSDKITQMYEVARKVDQLIPGLANVLQTLASLHELHEQALQFSKCLTTLEGQQVILGSQLASNEELGKQMKARLEKDVKTITENIARLEVRMEAFKK